MVNPSPSKRTIPELLYFLCGGIICKPQLAHSASKYMYFILDTKILGGSTVPELNYPLLKYAMFINNIQIIVQKNSVIEKYIYIEELHKILSLLRVI